MPNIHPLLYCKHRQLFEFRRPDGEVQYGWGLHQVSKHNEPCVAGMKSFAEQGRVASDVREEQLL